MLALQGVCCRELLFTIYAGKEILARSLYNSSLNGPLTCELSLLHKENTLA